MATSTFDDALRSLSENLTCMICLDLVEKPVITPCCGQIICRECVTKWMQQHDTCPYCRHTLSPTLSPLNWECDFRKFVSLLKHMTTEMGFCQKHQKPAEFVCHECCLYLCPDCLFEEITEKAHTGHSLSRLSDVLNAIKNKIVEHMDQLMEINTKIRADTEEVTRQMDLLNSKYRETDILMCRFMNSFNSFVSRILAKHEKEIKQKRESLSEAHQQSYQLLLEGERLLKSADAKQLDLEKMITKVKEMKERIDELRLPIPDPTPHYELMPPYVETVFELPMFRDALEYVHQNPSKPFLFTDPVEIYGNLWRLKVYPNGNKNGEGTHVSIFLELKRTDNNDGIYVYYKTEIFSTDPAEMPVVREYESKFILDDSWGWNKAISLDRVLNHGFLAPNGSLIVHVKLRPSTYYQACRDLEAAIRKKRQVLKSLRESK